MAEMALESQKEFIEELFDTDPNLIFVRDGNGRMIYCNQAVTQLIGIPRAEFLSQKENMFPAVDGKKSAYRDIENRVINNNEEVLMEEQITDKDGMVNYFQTIKKPLKTKDGDTNLLTISTNINKIKYYERENQKAMKAREDFFSAMSHEIRTPLNAIIGMGDLLAKRNPKKDQQKLLQTLNFSAKNLLGLINNILDFSKIEAGKIVLEKTNLNLRDLLKNIQLSLKSWAQNKGIELGLDINDNVPTIVQGDSVKLSQILNNLISNGLKFTDKGSVTISASLQEKAEDLYTVRFSITDTGIGIEEDKIDDIFNPFLQADSSTSRKYGGTGLGLSIVKNLVELQGGEISVTSKSGEGTTFDILLPFREADKEQPVQTLPINQIQNLKWQMRLKVLYVEDVSTNQILMEEMLNDWGISVEMANNGNEALEMIDDCVYDLILMDIQMPGLDGFETTRMIRAKDGEYFRNVPILAMTASTSESMKHEIMRSGMQDIVLKPVNIDELRSKIVEHTSVVDDSSEEIINTAEPDDVESNNHSIRFDKTDQLFLGNVIRYQEFLKKALEEFSINLELLEDAVSKQDLTTFRHISHRMKNILATFGIDELSNHLDEIRDKMQNGQLKAKDKKDISKGLRIHIEYIRDEMTNKLASLKWQ
jgi:PAS domain S-box-containing protein